MTSEPILIGIDVGSTNFKAAAYDTAGRPIACAHVPTPTRYPRPGWAYFDPDEVWDLVTSILREVTSALRREPPGGRAWPSPAWPRRACRWTKTTVRSTP